MASVKGEASIESQPCDKAALLALAGIRAGVILEQHGDRVMVRVARSAT
jgi:hypothetical protein